MSRAIHLGWLLFLAPVPASVGATLEGSPVSIRIGKEERPLVVAEGARPEPRPKQPVQPPATGTDAYVGSAPSPSGVKPVAPKASEARDPSIGPGRRWALRYGLTQLAAQHAEDPKLSSALTALVHSVEPTVTELGAIPLELAAQHPFGHQLHPQGLARDPRTGNLYLSAVEITQARDPAGHGNGKGQGHLFELDPAGKLLRTVPLHAAGEGAFHPSGMAVRDGKLYLALSAYYPHSFARILEVPLDTLRPRVLFEFPDHIGVVAPELGGKGLSLFSWDAETWYRTALDGTKRATLPNPAKDSLAFQDVEVLGDGTLLLTGQSKDGSSFGFDLVDEKSGRSKGALRWPSAAHRTPQGSTPFRNPTLAFRTDDGQVRFLSAPDNLSGEYRERPFGVEDGPEQRDDRGRTASLRLYALDPNPEVQRGTADIDAELSSTPADAPDPLPALVGHGLPVEPRLVRYFERRYADLTGAQIPPLHGVEGTSAGALRALVGLHRRMLRSPQYVQSRIDNPTTGTLDHLHAELVAHYAVLLGQREKLSGNVLELLRAAGHLHDIDRSVPRLMTPGEQLARGAKSTYEEFKALHMERSAQRTDELAQHLTKVGEHLSGALLEDLDAIIGAHETADPALWGRAPARTTCSLQPGVSIADLTRMVRDADSLAFFDTSLLSYLHESGGDAEKLVAKMHYMFDRMSAGAKALLIERVVDAKDHPFGPSASSGDAELRTVRRALVELVRGPQLWER